MDSIEINQIFKELELEDSEIKSIPEIAKKLKNSQSLNDMEYAIYHVVHDEFKSLKGNTNKEVKELLEQFKEEYPEFFL